MATMAILFMTSNDRSRPQTAAERAKAAGLKSLAQAADMTNLTTETLRNWYKYQPKRFEIILLGCRARLSEVPNRLGHRPASRGGIRKNSIGD